MLNKYRNALTGMLLSITPVFTVAANEQEQASFAVVYQAFQQAIAQNDFKQALPLARQALELGETQFATDSDNYLNLQFNYANMLQQNRDYKAAYALYRSIEEAFVARDGKHAAAVFPVRIERYFAASMLHGRDYSKAQKQIGKSLLKQVDVLSEQTPEKAAHYHYGLIAVLQRSNSSFLTLRKMTKFTEQAVKLMQQSFKSHDQRLVESQLYLAKLYKSSDRYDAATEQYEAIVTTLDSNLEFTHPWALNAHAHLVEIYESKGLSDKATEHCVAIGKMTPWDENILEPKPIYRTNPEYPLSYARQGREGYAKIEFDIDEYGFVANPRIIEVVGGERFGEASLAALENWRYAPKFVNGKAEIATSRYVQMDFSIAY